jgi:polyisoprenoid-binding protein YceI
VHNSLHQNREEKEVRQFGAGSLLQACATCIILVAGTQNTVASPVEYDIDQRYATIRFETGFAGLLHPESSFPRFQAHLTIDFARFGASAIEVIVDDRAINMSLSAGAWWR